MPISGYKSIEELSRTDWYVLERGRQTQDGAPILLKKARRHPAQASDVNLFRREFELLRETVVPGVPLVSGLAQEDGDCVLVLQDPGGRALSEYLHSRGTDLELFFKLAIPLTTLVTELHRRELVCRSLNPHSILVSPDAETVFLIDLSLATQESGVSQANLPFNFPRTLLPYTSPEQTGRMNRLTDYRTDFYSLGVIFYEMLTGSPPFQSEDTLEVIHGHIAKLPRPLTEFNQGIPGPLSDLVMKLLAKTAEERYQSAQGILEDLKHCQRERQSRGVIAPFAMGQHDASDRFLVPQKLYGRDRDVGKLLDAFDRVCEGAASMMLVAGYSGIGKTSLIQELYKPIVSQKGYFISGKFDQVGRNVPFGALIQAFRGLVQQLLTETKERLGQWRACWAEVLGANGGVLAEVIPEIELVIGKQPIPPALGATEALNRFQLVFQNFVGAVASRDHPLVVFLDDLQWADSATLSLLQPLLTGSDIQFLFLIGAYRDNEIDAAHPLARTLNALESEGASLHHVSLGPLELSDSTHFVRDTLQCALSEAEPLAQLVLEKTGGNPFFVIQFLKTLKQEGLLAFDYQAGSWTYQLDAIKRAGMTDNVIDLMTGKIRRLPPESQRALTLAACIGNPFDLETLITVSQRADDVVTQCLQEALKEGLIVPAALLHDRFGTNANATAPRSFAFLHDRVQQAAYALVPDAEKPLVHLTVGRLLLERWDVVTAEEKVFDVVHHFNLGSGLITDENERLNLVRLNLSAGQKAKASTAYQSALGYLETGRALVAEEQWNSGYDLMFTLHVEAAECKYLCGRFDEADRDFDLLLKRARTRLDKAQVYALRLRDHENLSRYELAVACGREALELFGVSFPAGSIEKQAALEMELGKIQALVQERPIDGLIDLPVMKDIEKRMVMKLLTLAWSSAYISGDQVLTRLFSATLVRLSLEYGNTEESAYGYATHTVTVGPISGDYASAYAWGDLALKIHDRFNDQKGRAKIHQQFHAHANYWRRPFQAGVPHAREATRIGLETGDFAYAGYGSFTECWNTMLVTPHLDEFVRGCASSIVLLEKLKMIGLVPAQKSIHNWARALQGLTSHPTSFSDSSFDEDAFVQTYKDHPFLVIYRHILKVHLCVLFEQFERAREAAQLARGIAHHLAGTIWPVYLDLFEGLALMGASQQAGAVRSELEPEILHLQKSLSVLALNCPENFRCAALWLTAGLEGLCGHMSGATEAYEQALHYARETNNLHHEALANELYGRFWRHRGNAEIAALYLMRARQSFLSWGAAAKARHLEGVIAQLAVGSFTSKGHLESLELPGQWLPGEGATASLDLATVTKAARAIAVEMDLEELLRKLMRIALENAGAQRGVFLEDSGSGLVLVAQGHAEQGEVTMLQPVPLERSQLLSKAVVHYVQKTGQSVVVSDAACDDRFRGDPYITATKPKSILCVPVIHQGKFGGMLYLENNLAANAFTAERLEIMQVLSSQAAISLANARLYDEMKKEAVRRQDAEAMLRTITEGTASVTGTDFFRSLVRYLATALGVRYAFVTECRRGKTVRAAMLAFWNGKDFGENCEYDVAPTPCGRVLDGATCYHGDDLQALFPDDRDLVTLEARSFLGVPMFNASGTVIGHIAVLDDQPMADDSQRTSVLRIFAARAAAELERMSAEENLRKALGEVENLKNRLHAENVYLQEEIRREHNFEEIVGSSPALVALLRQVEQVAPTDSTVLIYGETGTGKELIARAIHDRSLRRQRPLVKVNCGAISAGLVESELFGHVKGAFTGAIESRTGRFELANGGTLFLDEVGELPPETQVKLLRVLQEQEFEPVGSSRTIRVDVRIIAASNRNLAEVVEAGSFRSDLFYRLNVFPLTVPPLRDRRTDIPQLSMFFLSRFARKSGKQMDGVSQEAMRILMSYPWPGNIRELQNVIQRAIVLSPGPLLTLERDLFPVIGSTQPVSGAAMAVAKSLLPANPTAGTPAPQSSITGGSTLDEVDRRHILEVLDQTKWVIEGPRGAAQVLNLHPNTLRSRMKKLQIQRSSR